MVSLLVALVLCAEPLVVAPNAQVVLKARVTRVAIANPEVADVRPAGGGELLVIGKKPGRTTLSLWTAKGLETRDVVVDDGRADDLGKKLKELISPSLRVERVGDSTVVDGTLDSVEEWRRLEALVADRSDVKVLARLNPRVLPVLAQRITAEFHRAGLSQARAECVGQTVFLEGSVADEVELRRALGIAQALYGQVAGAPAIR